MVKTKVFVGNLSFKTQEAELAREFGVAGNVTSANIITRGPRSLGYGFVEFDSEEEAKKAVTLLNKKEIDGRPINVEIAKPREEGEEKPKAERPARRGRGRGRGRVFRQRGQGGAAPARGASKGNGAPEKAAKKPFYKSEAPAKGEETKEENQKAPKGQRRRFRRRRRRGGPRRQLENREESKTTLFVANLPFKFDDAAFGKVFSDLNISYKSAHVVIKRNGLSKGYGFVEFNTEADQKKALSEVHGKTVEGRELSVKVALTEIKTEGEGKKEAKPEEKKEAAKEEKPKAEAASPKKDSASPKTEKKEETK